MKASINQEEYCKAIVKAISAVIYSAAENGKEQAYMMTLVSVALMSVVLSSVDAKGWEQVLETFSTEARNGAERIKDNLGE